MRQRILVIFKYFSHAVVCLLLFSCVCQRELRGKVRRSNDKGTYLIIKEKNDSQCHILVDGEPWPYELGTKGKISPGVHKIVCGGSVSIEIKEGTIFTFDYWGP